MLKAKKPVSIVLAVLMAVSVVLSAPAVVSAVTRVDTNFGNWRGFVNDDGTFTVTGVRKLSEFVDDRLVIPETIDNMKVTRIGLHNGEECFFGFFHPYEIKELVLPDTLEEVETPYQSNEYSPEIQVFNGYSGIESLKLPDNPEFDEIDVGWLFSGYELNNLKTIECANREQLYALCDYTNACEVEELTIGCSVYEDAPVVSFNGYDSYAPELVNLKKLTVKNAEEISLVGMSYLDNLETLDFSAVSGLRSVELSDISCLNNLILPESVRVLSLSNCANLNNLSYPGDISNLSMEKLRNCPKLNIPVVYVNYEWYDSVTAGYSFLGGDEYYGSPYENSQIREIHIDGRRFRTDYWPHIHCTKLAFRKMPLLEDIIIEGGNGDFYVENHILYYKPNKYKFLVVYPAGRSTKGDFTIAEDVTFICCYAFEGCAFDTITIPENITADFEWDNYDDSYERNEHSLTDYFNGNIRMVKYSNADYPFKTVPRNRIEYYKGGTYNISYNLNGGVNNSANPASYTAGDDVIKLKAPVKSGYDFIGWTRNDNIPNTDYYDVDCNDSTRIYERFKDLTFTANWAVSKKLNPLSVKVVSKNLTVSKLKKKAQTVKAITVKKAKGKVTYKLVKKGSTASLFKYVKINSKGVITLKKWKKAKKGTYKIKVTITAAGNSNYNKKTVNKVVKIKIR